MTTAFFDTGLETVNKMDLAKQITINDDSFSGLGLKTVRIAQDELDRLSDTYGENLPHLIGLSLREVWFAISFGSCVFADLQAHDLPFDRQIMPDWCTTDGYAKNKQIASQLFGFLGAENESQQQSTFRDGTPFQTRLPRNDIFKGAVLYWFAAAATAFRAGDVEAGSDWLNEAQTALQLAYGDAMWDEGAEFERNTANETHDAALKEARASQAKAEAHIEIFKNARRKGADVIHLENRAMKTAVFAWLDSSPQFPSNEAAARAIIKQQPITHGTARDWFKNWKTLRPASTPHG